MYLRLNHTTLRFNPSHMKKSARGRACLHPAPGICRGRLGRPLSAEPIDWTRTSYVLPFPLLSLSTVSLPSDKTAKRGVLIAIDHMIRAGDISSCGPSPQPVPLLKRCRSLLA